MILSDPLEQLDDVENIKKYKAAGLIATKTVNKILDNSQVGCKLVDLHKIGTEFVLSECNSIYDNII